MVTLQQSYLCCESFQSFIQKEFPSTILGLVKHNETNEMTTESLTVDPGWAMDPPLPPHVLTNNQDLPGQSSISGLWVKTYEMSITIMYSMFNT